MPFNKPYFLSETVKLLNDADYERLKNASDNPDTGTIHLMNFQNWQRTGPVIDSLKQALSRANALLDTAAPYNESTTRAKALEPVSRLEYFNE